MALEPITRQEKIIAGQDLEPITRMEMFLKQFGGGGGGSSGGGVFRVNLTPTNQENQYSADKTYAEIVAAHKGGMEVQAVTVESGDSWEAFSIYWLANINGFTNQIAFTNASSMMGSWYIFEATMGSDGVVTLASKKVS